MNILITGVAGAIGSHVAEALVKQGHRVRGIDSFSPYYSRTLKEINIEDITRAGVQFFEANLAYDHIDQYVEGADVIYHFAAQPGISAKTPFEDYVTNNIVATHKLLEAAKRAGTVKLFVHASTSSVYGKQASGDETVEPKPTSYYGVSKLAAEQLALAYYRDQNLPVTVLRFFSVYGERERPDKLYHKFISSVLSKKPFTLYEGSEQHVRSYTHVSDIVDGCLLVLKHTEKVVGEIFNLGTDKTITTGEGIAILEEILGEKALITKLPKRPGDQLETAANIQKARRILGYDPKIAPQEGLRRQVAWYKEKILREKVSPSKKKVVVTGGAGFVGTHLVKELIHKGFEVHVVDTLIAALKGRDLPPQAILHTVDIRDTQALEELFKGMGTIDGLFHLAAIPSVQYSIENPEESHDVHVNGTLSVFNAARKCGVKKVIYSASAAAYGNQEKLPHREDMLPMPQTPYGLHKYAGEHYARVCAEVYGLPTVSLRYFNIYGPGANPTGAYASAVIKFLEQRKEGKPITITGDGEQTRDIVHVRDVVRANILALESEKVGKGEVINIGSGKNISVKEIAALIGGEVVHIPPRLELRHSLADITRAKELLSWEPTVSLTEGIAELKAIFGIV